MGERKQICALTLQYKTQGDKIHNKDKARGELKGRSNYSKLKDSEVSHWRQCRTQDLRPCRILVKNVRRREKDKRSIL